MRKIKLDARKLEECNFDKVTCLSSSNRRFKCNKYFYQVIEAKSQYLSGLLLLFSGFVRYLGRPKTRKIVLIFRVFKLKFLNRTMILNQNILLKMIYICVI